MFSGGNTDMIFVYAWKDGTATLAKKFVLAKEKTPEGTGTSPTMELKAQWERSPNPKTAQAIGMA
jgi:hypothetical protein